MSEDTLSDIVEAAEVTFKNDLPAAIVYLGKVVEGQLRIMNEILDRTAIHFEDDQYPCSSVTDAKRRILI